MVDPEFKLILKELYGESVQDNLDWIRLKGEAGKVFQRIRESYHDDWRIVELCREALFDNAKIAALLREEIENGRAEIKELERL